MAVINGWPKLVLASRSPRRRELLLAAGIPHALRTADVDESPKDGEAPVDYVRRVARDKAMAVICGADEVILAADTAVVCEAHIIGKPSGADDADRILQLLSNNRHDVFTGVCLRGNDFLTVAHESTRVWFGPLTTRDIEEYIASGEPMDKAGAYGIQGIGSRYIERIEGSYSNVVGLPVALVWRELRRIRNFPS